MKRQVINAKAHGTREAKRKIKKAVASSKHCFSVQYYEDRKGSTELAGRV